MPWITKNKVIPCIVCRTVGGWWKRVYNGVGDNPETVWVKCEACDGKGRHIIEYEVWEIDRDE